MRKRDLIIEFLQLITGIGQKKGKKAAPRFELGIKDLQSSALPLGHAALPKRVFSPADRISQSNAVLLVISNGHGEDLIALRILEALHQVSPNYLFEVLPLVGEGRAFEVAISQGWLKKIGPTKRLPSGGFSNQSLKGFVADLLAGLFILSFQHWLTVLDAARNRRVILAVGDLLPLFFAWSSGACYAFIGTPKSDYTWRSGPGNALSDFYHRFKGTEWDPWEWILMRSSRCKMVAVRDRLTARGLRRHGVKAQAPGNPMMDGLQIDDYPVALEKYRRVLLLCGSRMPEAEVNFQRLLKGASFLLNKEPLVFLVALGAEPDCQQLAKSLELMGYRLDENNFESLGAKACWIKGIQKVLLGPGQFTTWASWAEVGVANAGTATEQLVGLGIPALSLPGKGPQFKNGFAKRQSRLLGGAVKPCKSFNEFAQTLQLLLEDRDLRKRTGKIGAKRMGSIGGSKYLADLVSLCLFEHWH